MQQAQLLNCIKTQLSQTVLHNLKKTKLKTHLPLLILGLLLISSCSIFQSKYVEIESEDGVCYDEYYGDIIENKVIRIKDSTINYLTFTIVNTKETESESEL